MIITFKQFDELTTVELHAMLKLRFDIFILEQACLYPEIDGKDPTALHCLAYDGGTLAGTLRLFENADHASIGRVAVHADYRSSGIGAQMMRAAVNQTKIRPVNLSAQSHLSDWYARLGFETTSDIYDDDGVLHVDMTFTGDKLI
ncbi:MAG: GNAT family N-acetyltransferase [Pikeienuella sp.]